MIPWYWTLITLLVGYVMGMVFPVKKWVEFK